MNYELRVVINYPLEMNTYALADEADFIALRSQLTLPTKPTSSGDEVNSIFEGDVYTFFRLLLRMV